MCDIDARGISTCGIVDYCMWTSRCKEENWAFKALKRWSDLQVVVDPQIPHWLNGFIQSKS